MPEPIETPRILVAGVGNVFLGDDGFGVEVVERLRHIPLGAHVRVADFGIRGVHLAYELLDGQWDRVVLIDAVSRGMPPGTLSLIDPGELAPSEAPLDAHALDPAAVLANVAARGGTRASVLIVGCEPERLDDEMGLSEPVAAAVERALRLVQDLVTPPVQEA